MRKIIVNEQEIEVISFEPNMDEKSEKTITIKISESTTDFSTLKELLKDNTSTISYYENDKLMSEYDGYSNFECRYSNGTFLIDLRKGSLVEQIQTLLNANERISREANELKQENSKLSKSIEGLSSTNNELRNTIDTVVGDTSNLKNNLEKISKDTENINTKVDEIKNSSNTNGDASVLWNEISNAIQEGVCEV